MTSRKRAAAWHFVESQRAPLVAYGAAALGTVTVGLIHGRLWNKDPWARRKAATTGM